MIKIELKDRKGATILPAFSMEGSTTVLELKKHLLKACDAISKQYF